MIGFWKGFTAPIYALRFIFSSPKLLGLVLIPLCINIALYTIFFYYGAGFISDLTVTVTQKLTETVPSWLAFISTWLIRILGWLIMVVVAALSFTILSGLVCAPFNDILSRSTVRLRLNKESASQQLEAVSHPLRTVLGLEVKRMALLLGGSLFALLFGMIPLMQLPALAVGALLISFEYFGYPVSQKSGKLRPVLLFTLRRPFVSLGLGSFLLLLMALPFTSIIYIPLAVVGGSLIYAESIIAEASKHKKT